MEILTAMFAMYFGALISFGRLEMIFTGFFQVVMVIAIVLFILGVFLMFFPQGRQFLGGLIGR